MSIKSVSVITTTNITSTTFTDIIEKEVTTTGAGLKLQFTASVEAAYFSTVKFKLLVNDEPIAFCLEDIIANGFASLAMQAAASVGAGTHTVKVQAAKAESANGTITIDPANGNATLFIEEVEIEEDLFSEFFLSFDGSDDKVVATNYKGITGTAARSFSWWMNLDTLPANGAILDYGTNASHALWDLHVFDESGPKIVLELSSGAAAWAGADNADLENIADNNWHHFALTAPASGDLEDVKLYMDGVQQTIITAPGGGPVPTVAYDTGDTYDLTIGERNHDGGINLAGGLDEIAIFSSVLTSTEIVAIYNSGVGLDLTTDQGDYGSSANLELYYKIEEGTGTVTEDLSGNNRDGDIDGAAWGSPGV